MTLRFLLLFIFLITTACAEEYCCTLRKERSRSDNIPFEHVAWADDDYLTGYIQSLIDMHYYEFQVRVVVIDRVAYLFNLPRNCIFAYSILCFVNDVPTIKTVQPIKGSASNFLANLRECNPCLAQRLECSNGFQNLLRLPCADCRISGIWLPQNTLLFAPLIADPRQVMNAASLRFNDDVIGKHVGAPSFGGDFIVFRWKDILYWHGDMDIGVQAGIFNVFDLDHPTACMVNTDFFVAFLLTYAFDCWSFRFRLWHLSCHIGDEFLLSNPGFDRRNVSDEGIDFFVAYQFNPAIRLYAGVGDIFDRDKEFPEKPFYIEGGSEIRVFGGRSCYDRLYIQPFLAMHFRSWSEHRWAIDQTYALGVEWSKLQGVGQKFRIYFEYHDGYSKEGQFVRLRSNYVAVKVNYGY